MIWKAAFQNWCKFIYCSLVNCVTLVGQRFQVGHFGCAFEDDCELVTRHSALAEYHSVYQLVVQVLAGFTQALTVTVSYIVTL